MRGAALGRGRPRRGPSQRLQPRAARDGARPFAAVVATLRELGFDGVVSVECRLRGEPREAVRACGHFLRGLLAGQAG